MGGQLSIEARLKSIIPQLTFDSHKGACGKVAIIGGSVEYTGAPYFSGISALRVGCDLAHIFCHQDAAIAIKSYSPELIVHPFFKEDYDTNEVLKWLDTVQALVVGPGLGRDESVMEATLSILKQAITKNIIIILDADGLFLINNHLDLIRGKKNIILTPNVMEYRRLCDVLKVSHNTPCNKVALMLGGVTILQKGQVDEVSNGSYTVHVKHVGSPRRCGGQGDVLSGSLATFVAWSKLNQDFQDEDLICCSVAASALVKECSSFAFTEKHRGVIASDIIESIPSVFDQVFGQNKIQLIYE
ncbi:hypothetical protein EHI8A_003410 [Entamoeba histolytica HM-1:IMSS-B]|uniref:ATP-dependent (S)-NAD(P)H-hydrate dehydratase n=6 Tax=Entamoeba histolytica TaxID=5759 RepID=NNRD_ENTH1|nr:hypothetical protein, conserved [Entamoeba histolytica HM-1:IMSS]C4LZV8.1 RecName: Full=ATP-dependent (S)-NAD(P)H-hydrate dehydratase; AltName: Full=ATP-dependent NAD(P)HX dehydratase [Entamoeba histolytica HM-1:IMSS]EMD47781.1 carbohydrate kinase family protein [Entamoeba histolytica KU27]EMH74930.1 hypothetical protein EHI8A_003410 [Entamoeba histolytica HM-1:IMSS-B]EMS14006.1 carbohydrate kinase family protein [Entamoeba histolytica HM-3:IMSS]ENY64545.1 carbohydrate kinase family protein|eukprot:XP_654694.1 hypothetical protein, conserved [Entamoeba histolytica HM-1:IMSS]